MSINIITYEIMYRNNIDIIIEYNNALLFNNAHTKNKLITIKENIANIKIKDSFRTNLFGNSKNEYIKITCNKHVEFNFFGNYYDVLFYFDKDNLIPKPLYDFYFSKCKRVKINDKVYYKTSSTMFELFWESFSTTGNHSYSEDNEGNEDNQPFINIKKQKNKKSFYLTNNEIKKVLNSKSEDFVFNLKDHVFHIEELINYLDSDFSTLNDQEKHNLGLYFLIYKKDSEFDYFSLFNSVKNINVSF